MAPFSPTVRPLRVVQPVALAVKAPVAGATFLISPFCTLAPAASPMSPAALPPTRAMLIIDGAIGSFLKVMMLASVKTIGTEVLMPRSTVVPLTVSVLPGVAAKVVSTAQPIGSPTVLHQKVPS